MIKSDSEKQNNKQGCSRRGQLSLGVKEPDFSAIMQA
jgi:hypothetical protein